ncbi:TPA: DUF551 domain-containing protein [Escherichia coli]|nr:DUF551 domain-containing protein [Escherichia coli]HAH6187186.1 DUF551 domain-containing protein [Escherichia coli]HBD2454321.1 DUF551 domain-containing protein [Escherichia coli]HCO2999306.1 DUF551 domain-containing protein [Escherichia coli]HDY0312837.1 DUF551 domain-containing protein [Escherichia coli]
MITITKERLLTIKQWRETYGPGSNVVLPAEEAEELARIALAALEVEPIGFRCRRNDNLGDWSYVYHREPDDFERKHLVIEGIYAAPPVPVVPEEKPMPNALSMLEREITQLIGDAQEATVTGYELIAEAWRLMDGQDPKTSDWHSKASKYLNSNIVEKVDDDRIEAVKAVLRRLAGNSPVIPGEVLSAIMKVARVRADFDDFDGDRRGIGDCLDEAEQELIVTINKYASQLAAEPIAPNDVREQTAIPPVPVTPDGWISCSERMPAQDDWILIYSKHGEYMAGQVQGEYVELSDGTLSWLGNALYWMPLPEPPQEAK